MFSRIGTLHIAVCLICILCGSDYASAFDAKWTVREPYYIMAFGPEYELTERIGENSYETVFDGVTGAAQTEKYYLFRNSSGMYAVVAQTGFQVIGNEDGFNAWMIAEAISPVEIDFRLPKFESSDSSDFENELQIGIWSDVVRLFKFSAIGLAICVALAVLVFRLYFKKRSRDT